MQPHAKESLEPPEAGRGRSTLHRASGRSLKFARHLQNCERRHVCVLSPHPLLVIIVTAARTLMQLGSRSEADGHCCLNVGAPSRVLLAVG